MLPQIAEVIQKHYLNEPGNLGNLGGNKDIQPVLVQKIVMWPIEDFLSALR